LETGGDGAAKAQPKQKEQPRQSPPPEPKPTQQGGSKSATPETKAQPKAQSKPEAPKTAPKKAVARSGGGKTVDFKLPDIGEGIAEGEIVKWLVAEGDTVEEHQPVVEVMTDKATVELPAPAAGTLA